LIISVDFQVSSGVPEGKGVSSSAALEVATMSAIAAAHGDYIVLNIICLQIFLLFDHEILL
jgi:galactokinase